jgi:hypothetical protein
MASQPVPVLLAPGREGKGGLRISFVPDVAVGEGVVRVVGRQPPRARLFASTEKRTCGDGDDLASFWVSSSSSSSEKSTDSSSSLSSSFARCEVEAAAGSSRAWMFDRACGYFL